MPTESFRKHQKSGYVSVVEGNVSRGGDPFVASGKKILKQTAEGSSTLPDRPSTKIAQGENVARSAKKIMNQTKESPKEY